MMVMLVWLRGAAAGTLGAAASWFELVGTDGWRLAAVVDRLAWCAVYSVRGGSIVFGGNAVAVVAIAVGVVDVVIVVVVVMVMVVSSAAADKTWRSLVRWNADGRMVAVGHVCGCHIGIGGCCLNGGRGVVEGGWCWWYSCIGCWSFVGYAELDFRLDRVVVIEP